ncbi:hypothetical protein C8R47DRAFT_58941 [Mycena vitilis]|nr:hypothetical protein C8R47DRAFT_58941 [Mycena vitilis]
MTIHFLDLPSEILILILHSLNFRSLLRCTATNRRLRAIIEGSALLQYRLAAQVACVEDNPRNTDMTSAQRLTALGKRQTAFGEMTPTSVHTIQMDVFPTMEIDGHDIEGYALSGGIFVMSEGSRKAVRWTSLASAQPGPVWERLEFDDYILEFGLIVPEEDLLVVVSSPLLSMASEMPVKLHFFKMSTKSAHPTAQEPVITISVPGTNLLKCPGFEVDICGSRVALLVLYEENFERDQTPGVPLNRVFIYDWKQGRLQMDLSDNYSVAVFLSPDVMLLAQLQTGTLQLWAIPDDPKRAASTPETSLQLPRLTPRCCYDISKVEYNPKGSDFSAHQPFHPSYTDSLVLLQVEADNTEAFCSLILIVPRRALLQQMEAHRKCLQWAEWGPPISRWLNADFFVDDWPTIVCGQRCVFLKTDGSVWLLDFNPYTWKKSRVEWQSHGVDEIQRQKAAGGNRVFSPSEAEFTGRVDLFEEPVRSELPFLGMELRDQTHCNGVFMDEEWIVLVDVSRNCRWNLQTFDGPQGNTAFGGKFLLHAWRFGSASIERSSEPSENC